MVVSLANDGAFVKILAQDSCAQLSSRYAASFALIPLIYWAAIGIIEQCLIAELATLQELLDGLPSMNVFLSIFQKN